MVEAAPRINDSLVSGAVECSARTLLDRHLSRSKEWFPHQLVPWGEAQDLGLDGGASVIRALPDGVASALWVGLLTEDNLPHYFHAVANQFDPDSAMGEWSRRWAAEEQRHSIVIRDWVCVTRTLDLVALERARMSQLSTGFTAGGRGQTLADGLVYLTLQELATRISHWNTGALLDPTGAAVLRRVAADENMHFLFYRDLVSAALEVDPSGVVSAIDRQVSDFAMPGNTIENFTRHASAIAAAGVYDYRVHYEQVLVPVVLKHWRLEEIDGLDTEAAMARDHVLAVIARLRRIAERMEATAARGETA
jgi:acyl-[acyl-carrier-protein] desaturase